MRDATARTVTIVGGGTAGWMTAAALARFLPRGWRITLIESEAIGTVGVGEATIPQILNFNAALGIDEAAFMAATQATFKLGIVFEGWRAEGQRYCHAFGRVGRDLGLINFYHYWLRAQLSGRLDDGDDSLDGYAVGAAAAYAGRCAKPDPARPAPAGPHSYAFHFDASLYADFLRQYAEAKGVVRREGMITAIARDGDSGDVTTLTLADGERVGGDIFIDCSGFRALLLGDALGTPFESWAHWLPCDRAFAVPSTGDAPAMPATRAIARRAGWQWRIPLQHRVGNGHVYCSAMMDDDAAAALLLANIPGDPLGDPRQIRFEAGRRARVWSHNVIGIGLATGFLEPLESTSIHMIQTGIERLLQALPSTAPTETERAAFNAEASGESERIRDFIMLHYAANGRDEAFWQDRRAMSLPDSLAARIDLFRETGRIASTAGELFTEQAWQQVMIGQGLRPRSHHPLADHLSDAELDDFLAQNRRIVVHGAAQMPLHLDYLAQLGVLNSPPRNELRQSA